MDYGKSFMTRLLAGVNTVLESEPPVRRPADSLQLPGGLVLLRSQITTLIVPDLHGRDGFLPDLLRYTLNGKTVFERLHSGHLQIVCVGDGMHSESRGMERWRVAYQEYQDNYEHCPAMAAEMKENFRTMALVMRLKTRFPDGFHFLKGNHENILDEDGNGNHPFAKFAAEGPMTAAYVRKFYGEPFIQQYSRFEKNLPLLARGDHFVVSHARPKAYYPLESIIEYRSRPDVIEGLTWTRHISAAKGVIEMMLNELIGDSMLSAFWFCGHTAIAEPFKLWAQEPLVEIHHPHRRNLVIVDPVSDFQPERDIVTLPSSVKAVLMGD
jgi:hypothetical protein